MTTTYANKIADFACHECGAKWHGIPAHLLRAIAKDVRSARVSHKPYVIVASLAGCACEDIPSDVLGVTYIKFKVFERVPRSIVDISRTP